jgi:predicted ferric reductase
MSDRSARMKPERGGEVARFSVAAAQIRQSARMGERRIAGLSLAAVAAANGVVVVALWWRAGGLHEAHGTAEVLVGLGRITGLIGAYLSLVMILLLGRIPVVDRAIGLDRLARWHRWIGHACLWLLIAHTVFITAGYTVGDRVSLWAETERLISTYPGVITATAGLVVLIGVVVSSVVIVRRRLRYETWYFVHLYAYLAIALAFSHQIATGTEFVGRTGARAYWIALYAATLGALVVFRVLAPLVRGARLRLRVERVVHEGPGVVSLEIGGVGLDRLRARAGQFFGWRFLTRDRWWEVHPFSLSAAPDGRRLRITVKDRGDFTARLARVRPGTRVLVEGPYGGFTAAARRRPRVALIAGGVGITPVRALLEEMPGGPGDITVVYRAARVDDVILRDELDALATRRGVDLHYVVGEGARLSAGHLRALVADIAERDVYLCGPPAMIDAIRASLRAAGVGRRQIVTERFEL